MAYLYHKNCTQFPTREFWYSCLVDMIGQAIDITYRTFMSKLNRHQVAELFPQYDWRKFPRDLTLKQDWAVSYHRSKLNGERCYFIKHSGIEYIFLSER